MRSILLALASLTTVAAQYGMGGYGMGYGGYGGYGGMGGMYSPYTMGMMGGYGGNGGMMGGGGYGGGMMGYGGGMNYGGMGGMGGMMPGLAYSVDQYGGNVLNAGAQQTSNYGLGYGAGTVNGGSAYGLKNTYSSQPSQAGKGCSGAQGVSTSKTTNPLTLNPLANLLNPANNILNQPNVLNPLGLAQANLLNPLNGMNAMFPAPTPMMSMYPWAVKAKAKQ